MKFKSVATEESWKDAIGVLISKTAVPGARKFVGTHRPNAVPVFLIEDNRSLRDGLASMLRSQGLELLAMARSRAEILREVTRRTPELLLLGSSLGRVDGVRIVEAARKLSPEMKVLVRNLPAQDDGVAYVRAGVSGFIKQDAPIAELVATIRTILDGGSVLPPLMTKTLFSHVARQAQTRRTRRTRRPPSSPR